MLGLSLSLYNNIANIIKIISMIYMLGYVLLVTVVEWDRRASHSGAPLQSNVVKEKLIQNQEFLRYFMTHNGFRSKK